MADNSQSLRYMLFCMRKLREQYKDNNEVMPRNIFDKIRDVCDRTAQNTGAYLLSKGKFVTENIDHCTIKNALSNLSHKILNTTEHNHFKIFVLISTATNIRLSNKHHPRDQRHRPLPSS